MTQLDQLAEELVTTGRTLRRAANDGAIRVHREGPRRLTVSPGEIVYVRRHWPLLSSLRRALRTEPNVRFGLLYGSTARGDDDPESDVDVLVALADEHLTRAAGLAERLSAACGREVRLLRLSDAERNPVLLAAAAQDGRVLIDRDGMSGALRARREPLRRAAERSLRARRRRALNAVDALTQSR
ncbi:MAG TPA: nucleotidyltransferase domain-containing protein [Solirubrobacterales bacterium]|nr:nucleotidyltransferase domain-containing protein [Solirubrobacterales bacterium]